MGFQRCAYVCAFLRGLGGAEEQENMPPNTVYGMRMRHGVQFDCGRMHRDT